ncbi:LAME_0G07558g1_1 [Lachancea meyersii CBS 8951]|uniref:LAME_0G07558g1_1 n=1 Tax=Lachancea meyersii CBS 8951 TaxID=1266667 RepID=A0A1G4K850_9SACH|nr:LAME_0G07558g1_1 [Lachancea meyersii CBS 8951]
MNTPELPPKATHDAVPNTTGDDLRLPENCSLLPAKVIEQMVSDHREYLRDYVMRFEDCKDVLEETSELKKELLLLLEQFENTEERRERFRAKLSDLDSLEKKYETSWAKLNTLMNSTYSNPALTRRMQKELQKLESQATALESDRGLDIDEFIKKHLELRQQYHTKKEILLVWKQS